MEYEASPNKQEENRWRITLRLPPLCHQKGSVFELNPSQTVIWSGKRGSETASGLIWAILGAFVCSLSVGVPRPPNGSSRTVGWACRNSANAETGHGIRPPDSMKSVTCIWRGACVQKRVSHAR